MTKDINKKKRGRPKGSKNIKDLDLLDSQPKDDIIELVNSFSAK